jgi:hypothetical protein
MRECNMETMRKREANNIKPQTTKTPEDIIHQFNTKEIDEDWSFAGYKPSDTGRDVKTGRFANNDEANTEAYPIEYIVVGLKE